MKILVTGATGFVGKTVVRKLKERNLNFCETSLSMGVDLRDSHSFFEYLTIEKPDIIINCASFVGGIQFGYEHPAELFKNNFLMEVNLLEACRKFDIKRLINPISNCTYPAAASFFKEEEWWDGPMHESVMVYGFARKGMWMGSWAYNKQFGLDSINLIMPNMYGPGDHFQEVRSHALGALIMKFEKARINNLPEVIVWGTGAPVREWLYVEDGAEALIRGLDVPSQISPINIGVGKGISIADLALLIKQTTNYQGRLVFDTSKPDGAPYKTMDSALAKSILNWEPKTKLKDGIEKTIAWYRSNIK